MSAYEGDYYVGSLPHKRERSACLDNSVDTQPTFCKLCFHDQHAVETVYVTRNNSKVLR